MTSVFFFLPFSTTSTSTSASHMQKKLSLPLFSLSRLSLPTHTHTHKKHAVIVKASSGPRYVVGCRPRLLAQGGGKGLSPGTRVTLDMTTLTIMRSLKREVDPVVHNMAAEDPGKVDYSSIGGLGEQVRRSRFFFFFFEETASARPRASPLPRVPPFDPLFSLSS